MKSLRIKYLQHVPFEGPAYIAQWADQHGHSISPVKLYASDNLPAHNAYNWLVILSRSALSALSKNACSSVNAVRLMNITSTSVALRIIRRLSDIRISP